MRIEVKIEKKYICPKCGVELELEDKGVKGLDYVPKKRGPKVGSRRTLERFTPEEVEKIKVFEGSISDLAKELGKPYSSVWSRWNKEKRKSGPGLFSLKK